MQLLDNSYVGELNNIRQKFLDTNKCCTNMFQLWLSRSISASWEDFIIALNRSDLPKVAKEVSEFYYGILHTYECAYMHI